MPSGIEETKASNLSAPPMGRTSRAAHFQAQFPRGDFATAELRHDAATEHDQDTVREGEDLVQFRGDEQDASTIVAGANDAGVNELNGAHVHPARGLGCNQQLRLVLEFPRDDELLLIATGQLAGRQVLTSISARKVLIP